MSAEIRVIHNIPEFVVEHLRQTTSLQAWLGRAKLAGVDAIPALFGPSISVADILKVLSGRPTSKSIESASSWLVNNLREGLMWRWDVCAPSIYKDDISINGVAKPSSKLVFDDARLLDILYRMGRKNINICVRPIIKAWYHEGFPVEFRSFVFPDKDAYKVSVSNYHVQRGLPRYWWSTAKKVAEKALRLANSCGDVFENGFTADFLIDKDMKIIFLNGGPAWEFGANPCCFNPDNLVPGKIVLMGDK